MQQQLREGPTDPCQAAHWALSLGLRDEVNELLASSRGRAQLGQGAAGLAFRLARAAGAANPYGLLCSQGIGRPAQPASIAPRTWITLQGGIGDCLEDLAKLLPWAQQRCEPLRLNCSHNRRQQLERLMPGAIWACAIPANEASIASKALMALLGPDLPHASSFLAPRFANASPSQRGLLCCWTAQGQGDRFSSWSRSLPFAAVLELYQTLLARGWEPHMIVDITAWKPWEAAALRQLGVQLLDPAAGDVLDLAELVSSCSQVVSIDSALVHLCGAMGRAVQLLQPGSSYARCCQVWRQERFGCWQAPLQQLQAAIRLP